MNGIIIFLKPPGMSSGGAVGFFRKTLHIKKIGHAGTLDPGACGVLVIMVGKATKLSDRLMSSDKTYIGEIAFGKSTDTQDSYGSVVGSSDKIITKNMISNMLPSFIGEIDQTPSKFSAIKVNGQKAYHMARNGQDFILKSRKIQIHDIKLIAQTQENRFLLKVTCSKGTYIRALFEDIAKSLDTFAYMSLLVRARSGSFDIGDSFTMDEISKLAEMGKTDQFLMSIEKVLSHLERIDVLSEDYKKLQNGVPARFESKMTNLQSEYRVYCKGIFFGIGEVTQEGKIKLKMHLLEEQA